VCKGVSRKISRAGANRKEDRKIAKKDRKKQKRPQNNTIKPLPWGEEVGNEKKTKK